MMTEHPVRFFLGANTPNGFYGFHETDLYDPRDGWAAFLIKSGAGTGKATFMREAADALDDICEQPHAIFCSSDPDSLDAVLYPDSKVCIIDATSPHIIEPTAYGECEQLVPFGCCLNADVTLSQTDEWFEAADACKRGHARCCRFMAAANSLLQNNRHHEERVLIEDKLTAYAKRLTAREFPSEKGQAGRETRRFLSAITPKGHVFFDSTAAALCPKLYVIEDEYGAVATRFLQVIRKEALDAGLSIITCPCPLDPTATIDHILIPSIGVGFLTSNSYHTVSYPVFRRIHASRFIKGEQLKDKKQQLRFNRRAAEELLAEAVTAAKDAKAWHDRMEALHIRAMDWELWREIADRSKAQLLHIIKSRLS